MKKIEISYRYILAVHILALTFLTSQRLVLLVSNWKHIAAVESKVKLVSAALLRGVWFDNVIASYVSLLPLIVLSITGLWNKTNKITLNILNCYYVVFYLLIFGIGTANIPYFNYFFKHLNTSIFNWNEEGGTAAGMILQEVSHYIYMLFFIVSISLFTYLIIKLSKKIASKDQRNITKREYTLYVPLSIALIALCLLGIRGRLGYNPIKTSQAYFCVNSFLNQLGINPAFFFMRDVIESSKSHLCVDGIISEDKAIVLARKSLDITDYFIAHTPPIARDVKAEGKPRNMNVVIILMESMSDDLLGVRENGKEITPFLNNLISKSYYFDHIYSAGTHTNHGILASLYGLPSLFDKNMMKNVDIPLCQGMPLELQKKGYKTMFFMPHEAQYDNMNAFLLENGITSVYGEENYPSDKIVNSFGVADDFLFSYAIGEINEKAKTPSPFFATILTVSNHPPYIIPNKYKSVSKKSEYQIVAFADDAIRQFMTDALKQDWAKNTVFVLLGDHGKLVGSQVYDMPLSYNHIPLIIYSPTLTDVPKRFAQLGGQVDVYPTVMGLLNRSYENNTFGVNLFKTKREYMFFSSDDALGCIDEEYFYSYNLKAKVEGIYTYQNSSTENLITKQRKRANAMRDYSAAMFQTASYMFKNKLLRVAE